MKEIYLLRHGEKDAAGNLTERGIQAAEAMRAHMPDFSHVLSSDTDRTIRTASLLAGIEPITDRRAAYAPAAPEAVARIVELADARGISFFDAARIDNDPVVVEGITGQARLLNALVDETLERLDEDQKALIVSHDLTIVPAMALRDMPDQPIEPLSGYVISADEGAVAVRRYTLSRPA